MQKKNLPLKELHQRTPLFSFQFDPSAQNLQSKKESLFTVNSNSIVFLHSLSFSSNLPTDIYRTILAVNNVPQINLIKETGEPLNFKPISLLNQEQTILNLAFPISNYKNKDVLIEFLPKWFLSPELLNYAPYSLIFNISLNYEITTNEKMFVGNY